MGFKIKGICKMSEISYPDLKRKDFGDFVSVFSTHEVYKNNATIFVAKMKTKFIVFTMVEILEDNSRRWIAFEVSREELSSLQNETMTLFDAFSQSMGVWDVFEFCGGKTHVRNVGIPWSIPEHFWPDSSETLPKEWKKEGAKTYGSNPI